MTQLESRTLDLFTKLTTLQEQKSQELLEAIGCVRNESAQIQNNVTNLLAPLKNEIEVQKRSVDAVCHNVEKIQKDTQMALKVVCQRMRNLSTKVSESTPSVSSPELTQNSDAPSVPESVLETFGVHATEINILRQKVLSLEAQSVPGAPTPDGPMIGPRVSGDLGTGINGSPVTDHEMEEGGSNLSPLIFFLEG